MAHAKARSAPAAGSKSDPSAVVTKALIRSASFLQLSQGDVAAILQTSPATISRVFAGRLIEQKGATWELALLFIQVYRSLSSLMGGDDETSREWLFSDNKHLHGVPIERMKSVRGLVDVADYLDAMRGRL